MKTISRVTEKIQNHGDDDKGRPELHARFLVKEKLSADEHPPINKVLSSMHL